MPHFCADEFMALMAALPFLGLMAKRFHAWRHRRLCPHEER